MNQNININLHCNEDTTFKRQDQCVRAFSYVDYSIEPHIHDFYEMNIILGGIGIHQIESSSWAVSRGDVFVIPPKTVHAYSQTENLEVYHILLRNDFVQRNQSESKMIPGYFQFMEIEPFIRQNGTETMFLHLNEAQLSEIRHDIKYIEEDGAFDKEIFHALHSHTAWKIICYLAHLLQEQIRDEKRPTAKYTKLILNALEYIHNHFSEKISIDDLSKQVYLSRSTFLRNFQTVCGCSPGQYLNRYRIKKAAELLETSSLSQTEIAQFCGFYDLSHMKKSLKNANILVSSL